jgi:hypothetical protein
MRAILSPEAGAEFSPPYEGGAGGGLFESLCATGESLLDLPITRGEKRAFIITFSDG